MEVPVPAQRDSGFFSESIPGMYYTQLPSTTCYPSPTVLDDLRQPTHHSPSPCPMIRDSSPNSSSPVFIETTPSKVGSSYQFQDEKVSSSNGTRTRRGRGYENNRRHSRSYVDVSHNL